MTAFSYVTHNAENHRSLSANIGIGGTVVPMLGNGALLYGDVVYFVATAETVGKSTTVANYVALAGVVVGGDAVGNRILTARPAVGTTVCSGSTKRVFVQINGFAWVVSGAAITAIGNRVMASATTAGRVETGTTATQVVGVAADAPGGAASYMRMLIRQS